jgi:predicted metal-dependent hydrolase
LKRIKTYPSIGEIAFVKSRRARKLTLSVKPWRGVRVTLPWHVAWRDAEAFVLEHADWLRDKLRRAKSYEESEAGFLDPLKAAASGAELRQRALEYLPRRTLFLAETHGFSFRRISVRKSRTRWGSCSSVNNINLSMYLMHLPSHLIDYVILHELVHTIHKNHSPAFWSLLDEHTGNSKALAREIKKFRINPLPTF